MVNKLTLFLTLVLRCFEPDLLTRPGDVAWFVSYCIYLCISSLPM